MNVQRQTQIPTDTSQHTVLRMGEPVTCGDEGCFHNDCWRRRNESDVPCVVCESKIRPGDRYRILCRINGEVVTVCHEACERRMAAR